jgi:hypothetical protein
MEENFCFIWSGDFTFFWPSFCVSVRIVENKAVIITQIIKNLNQNTDVTKVQNHVCLQPEVGNTTLSGNTDVLETVEKLSQEGQIKTR